MSTPERPSDIPTDLPTLSGEDFVDVLQDVVLIHARRVLADAAVHGAGPTEDTAAEIADRVTRSRFVSVTVSQALDRLRGTAPADSAPDGALDVDEAQEPLPMERTKLRGRLAPDGVEGRRKIVAFLTVGENAVGEPLVTTRVADSDSADRIVDALPNGMHPLILASPPDSEGEERTFAGTLKVTGATTFDTGPHPEFSARGDEIRAPTTGGGEREASGNGLPDEIIEAIDRFHDLSFECGEKGPGYARVKRCTEAGVELVRLIRAALASEPPTPREPETMTPEEVANAVVEAMSDDPNLTDLEERAGIALEDTDFVGLFHVEPDTIRRAVRKVVDDHLFDGGRFVRAVQPPTEGENDG